MMALSRCFLFFPFFLNFANSTKILFIPMHDGESHAKSMLPLAEALASKGHQVAMWFPRVDDVASKISTKKVKIFQTKITKILKTEKNVEINQKKIWANKGLDVAIMVLPSFLTIFQCAAALEENFSDIQQILSKNWDLFITDAVFAPCHFILGHSSPNTSRINSSLRITVQVRVY